MRLTNSDTPAVHIDRLEGEDVVEVAAARIGVVAGQHVAFMDVVAEMREAGLQCRHDDAEMHRHGKALRHQPAMGVADRRRKNPCCS